MRGRQQSHRKLEQVPSAIIPLVMLSLSEHFYTPFDKLRVTAVKLRMAGLLFILLLLQGCGLFKKSTRKAAIDRRHIKIQEQSIWNKLYATETDQRFFEWRLDSLSSGTVLQIWPRGKFTFSIEKGFEGEAERVLIASNVQRSATVLKLKDSLVNHKDQLKVKSIIHKTQKQQNKDTVKTKAPAFWLTIGLGILVLTSVCIYKFLKQFKS